MAIGDLPSAELQLPGERRNGEDASRERGQDDLEKRRHGDGNGLCGSNSESAMPPAESRGDDLNNGHCHRRSRVDVVGGIF